MLAAVAAVVIVALVMTTWLLAIAGHAAPGTDLANSRLDAVRTGLAAGAGAGAAVGLMLAFRRQHHQEIATVLTDLDATERRITELYTKAVEQLGNDKAPVRLGGLYALERLAQDNPAHRQTIVNVVCAYLRMPFSPTPPTREPEATAEQGERDIRAEAGTLALGDTWSQESDMWQQERQVRLTAQRILSEHLRDDRTPDQRSASPPGPGFWPDIRLDLAGATLINFNLQKGVMADADFSGATFSGDAGFGRASFDSGAWFGGATFNGNARFLVVTFISGAWFVGATFSSDVVFLGATFSSDAYFLQATFTGGAYFPQVTFTGGAWFTSAIFSGDADFGGAIFSGEAMFDQATFSGGEDSLSFKQSRVLPSHAKHVWPTGWSLEPDGNGGYTVVRANDAGRPVIRTDRAAAPDTAWLRGYVRFAHAMHRRRPYRTLEQGERGRLGRVGEGHRERSAAI